MGTYDITGTLKLIGGIQSFPSGFTKRQIVIETHDKYPQTISLELFKEHTELTNGLQEGDIVKAAFNLRGNAYNGKYYTNLQAWRLAKVPSAEFSHERPENLSNLIQESQPKQPSAMLVEATPTAAHDDPEDAEDEIPF